MAFVVKDEQKQNCWFLDRRNQHDSKLCITFWEGCSSVIFPKYQVHGTISFVKFKHLELFWEQSRVQLRTSWCVRAAPWLCSSFSCFGVFPSLFIPPHLLSGEAKSAGDVKPVCVIVTSLNTAEWPIINQGGHQVRSPFNCTFFWATTDSSRLPSTS